MDPRDVVADGGDLEPLIRFRRNHHREVSFPASRREGRADINFFFVGFFKSHDEHVFGKPAFVAADYRSDSEREAFFAEKRISAVTRAK